MPLLNGRHKRHLTRENMHHLYIGWTEVTVICAHSTVSMLWGNLVSESGGEALSRYSNKMESAYDNVRIISILLRKWRHNNKHFSELAPRHGGITSGTGHGMKKLRHCHSTQRLSFGRTEEEKGGGNWLPVYAVLVHAPKLTLTAQVTHWRNLNTCSKYTESCMVNIHLR